MEYVIIKNNHFLRVPAGARKLYARVVGAQRGEVTDIEAARQSGKAHRRIAAHTDPPFAFPFMRHADCRAYAQPKQAPARAGALCHYFTETSSGDVQAANFINNVKLETGDLPPVVDIEEEPKDATAFSTELKKLILRLEDHYGVKPIIYSYSKYIGRYLQDSFFDDYKLWIAHYEVEEPKVSRGWTIWQYTDKGDIPGINEDVDTAITPLQINAEPQKSIMAFLIRVVSPVKTH